MVVAFLRNSNYNVVLIDWSPLTTVPWYTNAVDNMSVTGRYIARFVRFLHQQGFQMSQIHMIGFSLGAEVAGFVGKQLQEWNLKLHRITGLFTHYYISPILFKKNGFYHPLLFPLFKL